MNKETRKQNKSRRPTLLVFVDNLMIFCCYFDRVATVIASWPDNTLFFWSFSFYLVRVNVSQAEKDSHAKDRNENDAVTYWVVFGSLIYCCTTFRQDVQESDSDQNPTGKGVQIRNDLRKVLFILKHIRNPATQYSYSKQTDH